MRRDLGLTPNSYHIVSVGRLETVKGHDVTIRAVADLVSRGLPVRLTIVGDGSQRISLETLTKQHALEDDVVFVGHQSPRKYLRAADIFVLSSRYEGFGLAPVEAMMEGCMVIRSDVGGAEQIRQGETGFVVHAEDVDMLAERLAWAYENPTDRVRMGAAAELAARLDFSSGAMTDRMVELYSEVISCH